jgi:hypothetical protein
MHLQLRDPSYTERLASFLASVGQFPVVAGDGSVVLLSRVPEDEERIELEIYLRVWRVLYPDAVVELAA